MNKLIIKFGGMIASLALMITAINANAICFYAMHQPKPPQGAEKLRKF